MAYRDVKRVCEEDGHPTSVGEVEPPIEINLHRALRPLSAADQETLFERKEQPRGVGKTASDRRSGVGRERASISLENNHGFLLMRPYLLASGAAWGALDFGVAFCCGILAMFAHIGIRMPLLTWALPAADGYHTYWFCVAGVILFALCVTALSRGFGMQAFSDSRTLSTELRLLALSTATAGFALHGAFFSFALPVPTGQTLALEIILTLGALLLSRLLWRRHWDVHLQRNVAAKNILIAGADPIGREVRGYLASLRYTGYRFKGFVELNDDSDEVTAAEDKEIIGSVDNVISLARSLFVDEIIFSQRPTVPNVLSNVLNQARSVGVDVRLIPSFSETLKNRVDVQYLGDLPTIVLYHRKKQAVSHFMKRAIDIVIGSVILVVTSPLCLIIALLIKLQSPGPVFYRSKRVGFKGMVFTCYKFRTMIENADSMTDQLLHLNERQDILFKIAEDPRVTEVGSVLRKYSLDELPQLWNVLNGDMSLVGPRPSISSEVAQYKTTHLQRLDVVPGITGLWQVEGRRDPSFESYINLDSSYVKDWSIWLDLKIIIRTVKAIFEGTGS